MHFNNRFVLFYALKYCTRVQYSTSLLQLINILDQFLFNYLLVFFPNLKLQSLTTRDLPVVLFKCLAAIHCVVHIASDFLSNRLIYTNEC